VARALLLVLELELEPELGPELGLGLGLVLGLVLVLVLALALLLATPCRFRASQMMRTWTPSGLFPCCVDTRYACHGMKRGDAPGSIPVHVLNSG